MDKIIAVKYTLVGKSNTFSKGNCIAKNAPIIKDNVARIIDSLTNCADTDFPDAPIALRKPISPLLLLMLYQSTPNKPNATFTIKKPATINSTIIGTR